MSGEVGQKVLIYFQWKLEHNDDNIDYIQVSKYLKIGNREAESVLNELYEKEYLLLFISVKCLECGKYTDVQVQTGVDIIRCENHECGMEISLVDLPPKSDYYYKINKKSVDIEKNTIVNRLPFNVIRGGSKKMTANKKVKVFLSYSHKDESYKIALDNHLAVQMRNGVIETWNDRKLIAGSYIHEEIDEKLVKADVIILLISSDFFASDYCYEKEMTEALRLNKDGKNIIISVIVRDCDWLDTPLEKQTVLPEDGKSISSWANKDAAYMNVVQGIKKAIKEMSAR